MAFTSTEHLRSAYEFAFFLFHRRGSGACDFHQVFSDRRALHPEYGSASTFGVQVKNGMWSPYLVGLNGKRKSLITWFGVVFVARSRRFLQIPHIKHVIQAIVLVGDDIKYDAAVDLESVHVMVDDHSFGVVLSLHQFVCLSVYQVNQSLKGDKNVIFRIIHFQVFGGARLKAALAFSSGQNLRQLAQLTPLM